MELRSARASVLLLALGVSAACGARPEARSIPRAVVSTQLSVTPAAEPEPLADATTWARWANADYLIVAPRMFASALGPLIAHRERGGHVVAMVDVESVLSRFSAGRPDPNAVETAIRQLASHTHGKLRFVLLAGGVDDVDPPDDGFTSEASDPGVAVRRLDRDEPTEARAPSVPTFYQNKMRYERDAARYYGYGPRFHAKYPTDNPYSIVPNGRLAVGRVPARTVSEMRGFVTKVIGYEDERTGSASRDAWRRRVTVFAGPADFGEPADSMIESVANRMLDEELSYDYDVRFTFSKAGSPYAYRFDKLRDKFLHDMNDGAVIAAYVGHGTVTGFDTTEFRDREYETGSAYDASMLNIPVGKPVFFSFSCDTGAFDRPFGSASLAERMIMNPDGPIAVFASSRESHPYPNALYGASVIARFVNEHPATLGEGVLAVKETMRAKSLAVAELLVDADVDALKREHEALYNLFGDPATRLPYPAKATVTLPETATAERAFIVTVSSPSVASGRAVVTLEAPRGVLPASLVSGAALARMPLAQAFVAMAENHKKANEKVVARVEAAVSGGHATVTMTAPATPGPYIVKVLVSGEAGAAAGHSRLAVARP